MGVLKQHPDSTDLSFKLITALGSVIATQNIVINALTAENTLLNAL